MKVGRDRNRGRRGVVIFEGKGAGGFRGGVLCISDIKNFFSTKFLLSSLPHHVLRSLCELVFALFLLRKRGISEQYGNFLASIE